jgi:hypothetical protein
MTVTEKRDLFTKYHLNVKMIEEGVITIEEQIKYNILKQFLAASPNEKLLYERKEEVNNRILVGLVISWCEVVIKRLFYEPNAFTDDQINILHQQISLEQKWRLALKLGFYKAFSVSPYSNINPLYSGINPIVTPTLTRLTLNKYNYVRDMIGNDLVPAIDLRNKVQHGEWEYAFKPAPKVHLPIIPQAPEFKQDLTDNVKSQNILTVRYRMNQVKALYKLIHDLATFTHYGDFKLDNSTVPFIFFFNQNYNKIISNRHLLSSIDMAQYKQEIFDRYQRGEHHRNRNINV